MDSSEKYSLWFVPSGETATALQSTITELAQQYESPIFPAHVTLLADVAISQAEVVAQATRLAHQLQPFLISFEGVGIGETYFQSVFRTVKPTAELLNTYELARELFDPSAMGSFKPHLSLIYGDFSGELKQEIASSIANTHISFMAESLVVVPSNDPPEDWLPVATIPLI